MARERSPNRDKAKEMYLSSNGKMKLKDIAEELGVIDTQIRKWKSTDKWEQELKGTLPKGNKVKSNVTNNRIIKEKKKKEPKLQEVEEIINNSELNDKQRLFCIYYVKYFNATKAAIKAGYSKDTAYSQGPRLLDNVEVQKEIQRLKANKFKGAFLDKEDLLQKYIDIAFADISDFVEFGRKEIQIGKKENGTPEMLEVNYVDFMNSNSVDGTIITEISQGKNGVSIKLQDKMKALDFLAKHIGLLDVETQEKLKLAQERFEFDKSKVDKGDKDKPIEIIIKRKGEDK